MKYSCGNDVHIGDVVRARLTGEPDIVRIGVVVGLSRNGHERLTIAWLSTRVEAEGVALDSRWLQAAPGCCATVDHATRRLVLSRQIQAVAYLHDCELLQRADGARPAAPTTAAVSWKDDDGDPT